MSGLEKIDFAAGSARVGRRKAADYNNRPARANSLLAAPTQSWQRFTVEKQVFSPELDGPIGLKDPLVAAVLAWLIPGLGHIYQGRTGKGILLMVCILGTFLYGLFALGQGRVVYAAWGPQHRRPHYFSQIGVGLPALPALVQAHRARHDRKLLFGGIMAPPALPGRRSAANPDNPTEDELHKRLHRYFDLGTVYTMIAGLLNVLAVYDAWGGPAYYDLHPKHSGKKEDEPDATDA